MRRLAGSSLARRDEASEVDASARQQGRLRASAGKIWRLFGRLSLAQRFASICLVILVAGALIIGRWVSREIESGVIHRTAGITALYVDSFVSPHLQGLKTGTEIEPADMAELDSLLAKTPLGQKIVSFKVWSRDGRVMFATNPAQTGHVFEIKEDLRVALSGTVDSHLSDLHDIESALEKQRWPRLVETYSPVLSSDGDVIGAVEFYQLPDDLLAEVHRSQRDGWAIVGTSTVVMYVLLVGLVTGASRTITRQNRNLQESFGQQLLLEARIRGLNQRLRQAAGAKAQTDEQVLQRIAQDLHDGPAQDLALALLRFDTLERPGAAEDEVESLGTIQFAVRHALDEVRTITTGLHLPQLDGLSWKETVEKAVTDHRRRTDATVNVEAADVHPEPTAPQRIAVYRFVQEALSNASRHAGTDEQWVRLGTEAGDCVVSVEDRGNGFDVRRQMSGSDRRARLGLQGMRERTELLGGRFSITSSRKKGTVVTARIPLAAGDEHVE